MVQIDWCADCESSECFEGFKCWFYYTFTILISATCNMPSDRKPTGCKF